MSQLPLWLQYIQALGTIVIAIVGVAIAVGQLWLASLRLRHDYYDRRLKILEAARRLLAVVFTNANVSTEEFYKYVQTTADASFSLNNEIVSYLDEIRKKAIELIRVERRLKDGEMPDDERGRLADEASELVTWFTDQPPILAAKFKPFMQLTRPWVFSIKWPFLSFAP
jgi:hypothetical protein